MGDAAEASVEGAAVASSPSPAAEAAEAVVAEAVGSGAAGVGGGGADGGVPSLGDGLAKSVGLAFSAPTQNLQGVFKLVFDVVQKQQVVISGLREEVSAMGAEYPARILALEEEVLQLRAQLEETNERMGPLGAAPAPTPAPAPKYSVFVGNLPPDADTHDTQSLLDSHTFDDATHASIEAPASCDKWSSAHQMMHFDDVGTAEKVAETLDGAAVVAAPGQSPRNATATVLGVQPESRFERQILVRHVRSEAGHNETLAIVDEFIPEPEPCDLDGYGLRLIRFPSKVEALKAASALTGLEIAGRRVEAAPVRAVDEVASLYAALHDLVPVDEAVRHRTIVVSSASIDAEVSAYTLGQAFDDVAEAKLAPAPGGGFNIGRVTFKTADALDRGKAVFEGLRMGGCSVSGLAIELPLAEVLQKRVEVLEAALELTLKPHVADASARLGRHGERLDESHEAVTALHIRLDAVEELARSATDRPVARAGADQGLVDDLADRVDKVERAVKALEDGIPDYHPPVDVAPAGGPDASELASAATEAIMSELERIGILVAKESETIGRVYEISEECLASTAIKAMEDTKRTVGETKAGLDEVVQALMNKLGRDEFASLCERHGEPDNPLKPIFAMMEALVAPLEEHKADRKELDSRLVGLDAAVTARYEEAILQERKRNVKLFGDVNSNLDIAVGKVEVAEREVAHMKQQLLNDRLQVHMDAQKVVDDDILAKISTQHETMDKMRESLEACVQALDGTPNEVTVRSMLSSLQDRIISKLGGANAQLQGELQAMKRELPRKVTKEDVLRLLAKAIKDMSEKLKAPDDAMMVGRVPYRCIACNNTAGMHGKQADKVVHAGLSPVSATDVSRHSVIVQATYSSGRAGALKPLQRQSAPGIPVSR